MLLIGVPLTGVAVTIRVDVETFAFLSTLDKMALVALARGEDIAAFAVEEIVLPFTDECVVVRVEVDTGTVS